MHFRLIERSPQSHVLIWALKHPNMFVWKNNQDSNLTTEKCICKLENINITLPVEQKKNQKC